MARISDDKLTEEGIKSLLQPFCDKYLSGRSMWSRGWLEGARNRFAKQVELVFGPDWELAHGYYDADYTLTKEGWKIRIVLQDGEIRQSDYPTYGSKKEPPRAHFEVYVEIVESPALKKDREDRAAKKVADREDIIKNYQPDQKDIQRVQDVLNRFERGDQVIKHLVSMAGTIKSKSKAYRRGVAAYQALKENPAFSERDAIAVFDEFKRVAENAVNESHASLAGRSLFESLRTV